MNFPRLGKKSSVLPGQLLVVRAHRNLATLVSRVQEGDLVVLDQRDLSGDTARALLRRRPAVVINASESISGRFANLGPQLLTAAGVRLLEAPREQVLGLRDGRTVRLHDGTLYDGAVVLLDVRELDAAAVQHQMSGARSGLSVQLDSFAHAASEFVRREEPLLLHGTGAPELRTSMADRVVAVAGPAAQRADLKRMRRGLRRSRALLIGVDAGIDALADVGLRVDVAVLSGGAVVTDKALRKAGEVVLAEPGQAIQGQVEKLNLPASLIATGAAPADIGLLLAHLGGARLVLPVGAPATLDEFVDRDRQDQASNVLTRLRLGTRWVDAATLPLLRPRRRRAVLRAGVVAAVLAVVVGALAFTPSGERWREDVADRLPDSLGSPKALKHQKAEVAERDDRIAELTAAAGQHDDFAAGTAPLVVGGTLAERSVALIALPGADPETLSGLRSLIAAAGAQVTADVSVLPAAATPAQRGVLDALTSQMLTQAADVTVPAGATGYQRLGALLARAAAVPSSAHLARGSYDTTAVAVASGLDAGGLATAKITARAALTIVVAGEVRTSDEAAVLAEIASAYGSQVPTVVAGPVTGVLEALGAASALSTVVSAGTAEGQVATVLALAARTHGTVGHYGPGGADGAIPPLS
jgi:uncharacterized membrane-anchored protein